ncbi:MAG TPA: hypothetical protein VJH87_03300, partial [Vicinamibacteria bacterium]|nr:hypothetical protein [Vicinamibacteria bacterium]
EIKHELAKKVLARGRALGIRFMYVLSYGAFPEPVRALFPHLEWRNGFLCAHQPELAELTEKVWRRVVEDFGTDGWYAIRHRGEEEQPYGDPCRSVTKKEGFIQAFAVLSKIDPEASATAWTWGEKLPELFEGFPSNVRAVHVRHGMANVFGDRGEGREQKDGAPPLEGVRRWLSAQFTVFSGNEVSIQTGWSDARALARDAAAARADGSCEGFFQWPEWSDTSPWLSHAIARIAWDPEGLGELEPALSSYAKARHGERAERYLAGFLPLLKDGNARFMNPPRKRLLVPYFLAPESLKLLEEARAGARTMSEVLEGASNLYHRDFVDLVAWIGLRQAQVFEAAAYLAHLDLDRESSASACRQAEATWSGLRDLLSQSPELSIVPSARGLSRVGELSTTVVDSLWTLGCDFYNGYPERLPQIPDTGGVGKIEGSVARKPGSHRPGADEDREENRERERGPQLTGVADRHVAHRNVRLPQVAGAEARVLEKKREQRQTKEPREPRSQVRAGGSERRDRGGTRRGLRGGATQGGVDTVPAAHLDQARNRQDEERGQHHHRLKRVGPYHGAVAALESVDDDHHRREHHCRHVVPLEHGHHRLAGRDELRPEVDQHEEAEGE